MLGSESIVGVMLRRLLSRFRGSGGAEPVERNVVNFGVIPEHESPVRRMVADAHGGSYEAISRWTRQGRRRTRRS
jgi:hypothetical protein